MARTRHSIHFQQPTSFSTPLPNSNPPPFLPPTLLQALHRLATFSSDIQLLTSHFAPHLYRKTPHSHLYTPTTPGPRRRKPTARSTAWRLTSTSPVAPNKCLAPQQFPLQPSTLPQQPLSAPPQPSTLPAEIPPPTPELQADPSSPTVLACTIHRPLDDPDRPLDDPDRPLDGSERTPNTPPLSLDLGAHQLNCLTTDRPLDGPNRPLNGPDRPLDGSERAPNAPLSSQDLGAHHLSCLTDSNTANLCATEKLTRKKKKKKKVKKKPSLCNVTLSSEGNWLECDPTQPTTSNINSSLSFNPDLSDTTSTDPNPQHTKAEQTSLCNHLLKQHPSYILLKMDQQGILLGKNHNEDIYTQDALCYDHDGELIFRRKNGEVFDYLSVFDY